MRGRDLATYALTFALGIGSYGCNRSGNSSANIPAPGELSAHRATYTAETIEERAIRSVEIGKREFGIANDMLEYLKSDEARARMKEDEQSE